MFDAHALRHEPPINTLRDASIARSRARFIRSRPPSAPRSSRVRERQQRHCGGSRGFRWVAPTPAMTGHFGIVRRDTALWHGPEHERPNQPFEYRL
jgi:hypothetical protein